MQISSLIAKMTKSFACITFHERAKEQIEFCRFIFNVGVGKFWFSIYCESFVAIMHIRIIRHLG